jgi:protein-tyrosine phosphatase
VEIDDSREADISCYFRPASDWVGKALKDGGTVLVHCGEGISRAPAMVAAYLVIQGRSLLEAMRSGASVLLS